MVITVRSQRTLRWCGTARTLLTTLVRRENRRDVPPAPVLPPRHRSDVRVHFRLSFLTSLRRPGMPGTAVPAPGRIHLPSVAARGCLLRP